MKIDFNDKVTIDKFETALNAVYAALENESFEIQGTILIAHIQRIVCDKTDNDKEKSFKILELMFDDVKNRVERICEISSNREIDPPKTLKSFYDYMD